MLGNTLIWSVSSIILHLSLSDIAAVTSRSKCKLMLVCLCLKAVVYRKNYSGTYTVCWLMLVGVSLLSQATVAVSSLQLAGNMHCVSI